MCCEIVWWWICYFETVKIIRNCELSLIELRGDACCACGRLCLRVLELRMQHDAGHL